MSNTDRIAALAARIQGLAEFPSVECLRLRLRPPRPCDADGVFALFSHPEVMRFWSRPPMRSAAEAESYVKEITRGFERREFINWLIADLHSDAAMGVCTLYALDPKHLHCGVGYALHPDHQGKGLGREAVNGACQFAQNTLGFHRVEADVHPDNLASKRLLEACGFRYEGRLRQRFVTASEIQDSDVFGRIGQASTSPELAAADESLRQPAATT